jgi:hypothetical protein
MEITTEPEIYCPIMDETGNYSDKIPASIGNGAYAIRCPCSIRKDKAYNSYSSFSSHIKTKTHQKWIETMNQNKQNYYSDNVRLQDVVNSQKIIIARLEKEVQTKIFTIDFLSQQIHQLMNGNVTQCSIPATLNLIDY